MADRPGSGSEPALEPIDFDSLGTRRLPLRRQTTVFLALLGVLAGAAIYDVFVIPHTVPPWGGARTAMDYLFYASLFVLGFYVVAPLVRRPGLLRRYWWQLRSRLLALVATVYLVFFVFAGTLGPWTVERFKIGYIDSPYGAPLAQPPVLTRMWYNEGAGTPANICLGRVEAGFCHGTWHFPLGTTAWGADLIDLVADGFVVALQISLVTAALIVPIATVVGTVAAYYGGWIDEILMRYVDVQLVIPAVFLIIVIQSLFGRSLLHIVLVFGLLNWGSTARVVRADALQRIEEGYVTAAESVGASSPWVIYRHLVPNVSDTLVTAVTLQMPTLILAEATISFLGYGSPLTKSWGATINGGLSGFPETWWTAVVPAVALFLTAVAFHVLGDALRDIVDPQMEGSA